MYIRNKMLSELDLVVEGPSFISPVPKDSVGEYIYRNLIKNNNEHDALVDAKTGIGISYYDFLKKTCRLAVSLKKYGMTKHDVILICSENNLYFMQPVVAAFYLGIYVATANQNYTQGELLHSLGIAKPKLIFCSKQCLPKFLELREKVPSIKKVIVFDLKEGHYDAEDFENFVDKYTNKYFNPYNFQPEKLDSENHIAAILNSHLLLVPPIMILLAKSPNVNKYDLSYIKFIGCGAATLSKEIETLVCKRFKIPSFTQAYGLTGATLGVIATPNAGGKVGSCGKVLPGIQIKVRDPETGKVVGPNQIGELIIKGPVVAKGYYGNENATKDTFKNGWLYSGDLGYYDEEGFFFIVDRLKDLIKYRGFQVAPAELEAILLKHPKIKEVGVVSKKHEVDGEHPVAFVVKQDGAHLSEKEVITYVASHVNKNKHLHGGVIFVDEIPKNPSGKILRRELKKVLELSKSKL